MSSVLSLKYSVDKLNIESEIWDSINKHLNNKHLNN